jgi:hypothetical protein
MNWELLISPSGATIVICITIFSLTILFVVFPDRFRGLIFGYKDVRIELPRARAEVTSTGPRDEQVSNAVVEESGKAQSVDEDPLFVLSKSVDKQSRALYHPLPNPFPAFLYSGRGGLKMSSTRAPSGPARMVCGTLPGVRQKSPCLTAISSPP